MDEGECKSLLLKPDSTQYDKTYCTAGMKQLDNDNEWWASDSGSSTGSYYSDTDSSIVEWESEIGPTGEVFYIESLIESVTENDTSQDDTAHSQTSEFTRRRSTRTGKLMRLIKRKESKRCSVRNKKSLSALTRSEEKEGNGNKEVKFHDYQAGEVREVLLWVDPEKRHKLGRRASLCEAYFGIIPGSFSDKIRVMVAGFVPDGEAIKNKNIKIGDWLKSINSTNVTFQNLENILSSIITAANVTLELQRIAGIDVTGKLPGPNCVNQSVLVQQLVNKDVQHQMDLLFSYSVGVTYLKTTDLSEAGHEMQGVLYSFPRSTTKNEHTMLCLARGAFITLNHLLPTIVNTQPVSTTVEINGKEVFVIYVLQGKELFLISLPETCCSLEEGVKITANIVRTLEFTYQSLSNCFSREDNHSSLDHFFVLVMQRLLNLNNHVETSIKQGIDVQHNIETEETYKFESAFSVAEYINLPRDAQIQIDAALNEMEAMDYRDWNEDPMDCQRLYTILGSCIYHKCYLLGSHLTHEDSIDVHSYLRQNGLLNLVYNEPVKCLVAWKQVYPMSCNRGIIDDNADSIPLIPNGKWFLLVVGYGHDLLAVLLESGGCTAKYDDTEGPDVFYVEEAQETLKHMQKIGVTALAAKWIASNARAEVIISDAQPNPKPSPSLTENLLGFIKSSDTQSAQNKVNVNPSVTKKTHELASILKKRSPEENAITLGSVHSLHTSEDSLSQGTGAVSEISDEAMPILGRRANREKLNSMLRYSDDSDSDIDIYKNDSQSAADISNIRENLLNQAEYLIPKKITAGEKNCLYHYIHLDTIEGILISSKPFDASSKNNIALNLKRCVHIIHKLFHNTVRFKQMLNQDMDKTVINKSLIAVKEHGVLFESDNTTYFVVGRLYTMPHPKELYVCYQDSAPQNLIEIAFKLMQM